MGIHSPFLRLLRDCLLAIAEPDAFGELRARRAALARPAGLVSLYILLMKLMTVTDHSPERFRPEHAANRTGARYPTAALGTGNVLAFLRGGAWWVLLMRRAAHMAHGGAWGLLGGYLDLTKSEGPVAASHREILEESNGLLDLADCMPVLLTAYVDYLDRYTGQCLALGMFYALDARRADIVTQAVQSGAMLNEEATEFRLVSLSDLEVSLAALASEGGIGYPQERYFLQCAQAHIQSAQGA